MIIKEISWEKKIWPSVIFIYLILVVVATLQAHLTTHLEDGRHLTSYNNYVIFRQSFLHLIHHQDLYLKYKYEYWDVFKYTPTFALFMAPFALFPAAVGLLFWNLLNVFLVIAGLNKISIFTPKMKSLILIFSLIEMATSIQNEQSNGLVTGLILCAFAFVEKKQLLLATGFIVFAGYVKLLGLAALILFVFYPQFWRAVVYSVFWFILFFLLPLIVIPPGELLHQYTRWLDILGEDLAGTGGLSAMSVLRSWLHVNLSVQFIQIVGLIVFCLPLIFWKKIDEPKLKLLFASSTLVWIVIFNHKAESPSFVIAVIGVAIWYAISNKNTINTALIVLCLIFTQLSATDLFPEKIQTGFFMDYAVKAAPCVLIWIKMNWDIWSDLMTRKKTEVQFA